MILIHIFLIADPVIIEGPMSTSAPINFDIIFSCVINSTDIGSNVAVVWAGPDSMLPPPTNSVQMSIVTSYLRINVTNGTHEGQFYSCSVNYDGNVTAISNSAEFTIIHPPTVALEPLITVKRGDNITLTCQTNNSGTITITWTGPANIVPDIDVRNMTIVRNSITLLNIDFDFGGEYTCTATNEAGTDSDSIIVFLAPAVAPDMILTMDRSVVILSCSVQSFPNTTIEWEKENDMGTFVNVSGQIERNFTFSPIAYGDEGVYRCVVTSVNFNIQIFSNPSLVTGEHN